jgi:hypothetical protein
MLPKFVRVMAFGFRNSSRQGAKTPSFGEEDGKLFV